MRKLVTAEDILATLEAVKQGIIKQMGIKGPRGFINKHELHGVLCEEWYELNDALCQTTERYLAELMDIAVAAVFGLASEMEVNDG